MSGKGAAFRIDIILQSVNELRQEKQFLEQQYAEERFHRKNLEMKLEQERAKFCQSRERNSKMQETVKLAQQKVAQTDSQADRLNEINDSKQKIIADLNEKIKLETEKQENDVTEFQLKLSELTQFFRDAKRAYAKDNLTTESKTLKDKKEALIEEAETKNTELEDVTKAFENLSIDTNKIKEHVGEKMGHKGLTYKELKATIDQLTRKQDQLYKFLEWLESCVNKANTEIQEHNKRCHAVGQTEPENRMGESEMADISVRNVPPAEANQGIQSSSEAQVFGNEEHFSRNQYPDTPENYSMQHQNFHVEPANNVDHGLRNDDTASKAAPVTREAPAYFHVNAPVNTQESQRTPALRSSFFISLPLGRSR